MLVKNDQLEFKNFSCCTYKGEFDRQTHHIFICEDYWQNGIDHDEKIEQLKNRFIKNSCDYFIFPISLPYDFKAPF